MCTILSTIFQLQSNRKFDMLLISHKYYYTFFSNLDKTQLNNKTSMIPCKKLRRKSCIFGSTAIQFLFAKLSFCRRDVTDYCRIYHYLSNCRYTAGVLRPKIDIDLSDVGTPTGSIYLMRFRVLRLDTSFQLSK